MLQDAKHLAWLQCHWNGTSSQRDRTLLVSGLRKEYNLSLAEASAAVKLFLSQPGSENVEPEDVIAILKEESDQRHQRVVWVKWFVRGMITFLTLVVVLSFALHRDLGDLFGVTGLTGVIGMGLASTGRHKMAARAAAKLKDKRALGPLLELLVLEDKGMRDLAAEAVTGLLPLLEPEDFAGLTVHQKDLVFGALFATKKLDFAAAILGAVQHCGDFSTIDPIEQFAEGKSALTKKDHARAESLARMALADIRVRAAKLKIEEKLQEFGGSLPHYTSKVLEEHVDLHGS